MGLFDSISATNDKATDVSERYIKTSYKYFKLKIFQQLSISEGMVFKAIVIGSLAFMSVFLSAIALALYIGEIKSNYPLGFLMVGIIFLILSVIAYYFKSFINRKIVKKLSKKYFN
tara:strand:+ start:563 stop:910 length:348 start_codon:yes stop_codon:yes gene_type:complete